MTQHLSQTGRAQRDAEWQGLPFALEGRSDPPGVNSAAGPDI
jgi:hypothetical protein